MVLRRVRQLDEEAPAFFEDGFLVPMLGVQLHPGQHIRFFFGTNYTPEAGTDEYEDWRMRVWVVMKADSVASVTAQSIKLVMFWSGILYMTYLNWFHFIAGNYQTKYGCSDGGPGAWDFIREDMMGNFSVQRTFFSQLLLIIIADLPVHLRQQSTKADLAQRVS